MRHLDEEVLGEFPRYTIFPEGNDITYRCFCFKSLDENGKLVGYLEGNETTLSGVPIECWSNWYNKDGRFVASLERINDFNEWLEWTKTQKNLVAIEEKDFPRKN